MITTAITKRRCKAASKLNQSKTIVRLLQVSPLSAMALADGLLYNELSSDPDKITNKH